MPLNATPAKGFTGRQVGAFLLLVLLSGLLLGCTRAENRSQAVGGVYYLQCQDVVGGQDECVEIPDPFATPTPTLTNTPTPTDTITPSPTSTETPTPTETLTPTITSTPTMTVVPSSTPTPNPFVMAIVRPVEGETIHEIEFTDFEGTAFDQRIGLPNGDGIESVQFRLGYAGGSEIYRSPRRLDPPYCVWGRQVDQCLTTDGQTWQEILLDGEYYLTIQAKSILGNFGQPITIMFAIQHLNQATETPTFIPPYPPVPTETPIPPYPVTTPTPIFTDPQCWWYVLYGEDIPVWCFP